MTAERPHLTAADLAQVGAVLYGARWQSALARDLGVSDRTVRRWVAGTSPVPHPIAGKLAVLLVRRVCAVTHVGALLY